MTDLVYLCPHCQGRAEVAREMIGQVIPCPNCTRPFRPEVPLGKMMHQRTDGEWSVAADGGASQRSSGEKTIMTVHPAMFRTNPFKYLAMLLAFIVGLTGMLVFAAPMKVGGIDQWWRPLTLGASIVFGIFAAASLISMILWLLRTRFESLTITNERTIWARGILDRETSEVQHDDIRNIQIKENFIDRILGVGRIAISSAGQDDMEIDVHGVPRPTAVGDTVRSCQARMHGHAD